MSVTIKDVATAANVSISTVSLVLNGSPLVKHETRLRVQDAIKHLNYVPNQSARSLITKVNKTISVIRASDEDEDVEGNFNSTPGSYFTNMMWGIEKRITEEGYSMVLEWHNLSNVQEPMFARRDSVDGIICVGGLLRKEFLQKLKGKGVPAVLVGSRAEDIDYIDADSENALYQITKYIISCGHKEIAFLDGPKTTMSSTRKAKGFVRAMKESSLKPVKMEYCRKFSGEAGYNACAAMLDAGLHPSAVICGTDSMALGVERCLHDRQLRCPDDVSVTGYENGTLAEYGIPALTTMDIGCSTLGEEAVSILFNRIKNPNARHVAIETKAVLLIRDSVKNL